MKETILTFSRNDLCAININKSLDQIQVSDLKSYSGFWEDVHSAADIFFTDGGFTLTLKSRNSIQGIITNMGTLEIWKPFKIWKSECKKTGN